MTERHIWDTPQVEALAKGRTWIAHNTAMSDAIAAVHMSDGEVIALMHDGTTRTIAPPRTETNSERREGGGNGERRGKRSARHPQ